MVEVAERSIKDAYRERSIVDVLEGSVVDVRREVYGKVIERTVVEGY